MDFLFFIIYNSYFKDGNHKNDIPPLTVGGIFTVCFYCLFLFFKAVWNFIVFGNVPDKGVEKGTSLIIAAFCAGLVYLLFYYNKRYIRIYSRFKDNKVANSQIGKILGWIVLAMLFLSPFIFVSIRKNFL